VVLLCSCLFGVPKTFFTWVKSLSSDFWGFLLLVYWMFSMPLACPCSLSSVPTIHRFVFLMVFQMSCILYLHLMFFFTFIWMFQNIYFVFKSVILSLLIIMERLSTEFFIWLELFISRISISFFSEFLYLYWIPFSCPALSSLFYSALWIFLVFSHIFVSSLISLIILTVIFLSPLIFYPLNYHCLLHVIMFVELSSFGGVMLPSFLIFLAFLCWDCCIWSQVVGWKL
jgi:hypothetical protein